MRITQNMYFQNFTNSNNSLANALLNVNRQISSGVKVQYAYQDPNVFSKTVSLNNDVSSFDNVLSSITSGQHFSTQTDSTLNSMVDSLTSFKTYLLQAASGGQAQSSMDAIANELGGLKTTLTTLANTSLNGQYIFSGSATNQKPIGSDGSYQGNDENLKSFLGSGVEQTYNITGSSLFLGDESTVNKTITTNVPHLNQTLLHPDVMEGVPDTPQSQYITADDTIRDLMGSSSATANTTTAQNHFYIQGTRHDGTTFQKTIDLKDTDTVSDLMTQIGDAFGNTPTNKVVDVSLNDQGEFVIKDNLSGSSKLDFNMVANVDSTGAAANITDLNTDKTHTVTFNQSALNSYVSTVGQQQDVYTPSSFSLNMNLTTKSGATADATTPLSQIFKSNIASIAFGGTKTDGTTASSTFTVSSSSTVGDLLSAIKSAYQVSPDDISVGLKNGQIEVDTTTTNGQNNLDMSLTSQDSSSNTISALTSGTGIGYDTMSFAQDGAKLTSNVSQIVTTTNDYATSSTKLSEVSGTYPFSPQQLTFSGINANGNAFNAQISLSSSGSTFSLDGGTTNYTIYNAASPQTTTNGDDMTYKQLTDVMNMIVSGNLPASTSSATDYNTAVANANSTSSISLNSNGKLTYEPNDGVATKADFSLYDANGTSGLTFNADSSLTVNDPKTNFFGMLDQAIEAVKENKIYPDGTTGASSDIGVQNAISQIDDLITHVTNLQALSGSHTQALQDASDTTTSLKTNTQTIQADVIGTNIAEATVQLNQLTIDQQALYSTISKVAKLSLVNYL
jgi:flagellar hook-associated protein 3 FlgL